MADGGLPVTCGRVGGSGVGYDLHDLTERTGRTFLNLADRALARSASFLSDLVFPW